MSDSPNASGTRGVIKALPTGTFAPQAAQESSDARDSSSRILYKPYSGWAPWGVPRNELDVDHAVEQLHTVYFASCEDKLIALDRLLTQNERIVSRSGMMMSFSSIVFGILLFISNNPAIFTSAWQRVGFYSGVAIWVASTLRLLWSLKHKLPPPWEYNTSVDFKMTAKLYIYRMRLYNEFLIASVFCFALMMILLMPVSATFVDFIFRARS